MKAPQGVDTWGMGMAGQEGSQSGTGKGDWVAPQTTQQEANITENKMTR